MRLASCVMFAEEGLRRDYLRLECGDAADRELYKYLSRAMANLEANAFSGIQIPRRLIPNHYLKTHGMENLWKLNLPKGWRLLYFISSGEDRPISVVIEWLPHKEYELRFGY